MARRMEFRMPESASDNAWPGSGKVGSVRQGGTNDPLEKQVPVHVGRTRAVDTTMRRLQGLIHGTRVERKAEKARQFREGNGGGK